MQVGHWHLGRRRQEHRAILQAVHVLLKFRQLRGPYHAIAPNEKRRTYFPVAMLTGVQIEHELNQRALQPGTRAGETNEATPTDFRRPLRIEELQFCAERDVIEHRPVE